MHKVVKGGGEERERNVPWTRKTDLSYRSSQERALYLLPQSPSKQASLCNRSPRSLPPLLPVISGPLTPSSSPPRLEGKLWASPQSQARGDQGTSPHRTPRGPGGCKARSLLPWGIRAWDCPGCRRISVWASLSWGEAWKERGSFSVSGHLHPTCSPPQVSLRIPGLQVINDAPRPPVVPFCRRCRPVRPTESASA